MYVEKALSSHTTELHCTNSYTYSHRNLNFLQYTIQILIPHVMLSKWCVIRKQTTLNAIYPPCAEPEAPDSAVGWQCNKQTNIFFINNVLSHFGGWWQNCKSIRCYSTFLLLYFYGIHSNFNEALMSADKIELQLMIKFI